MQGSQDLMRERGDRSGTSGARRRDSARDFSEPVPERLPGDPLAEQALEGLMPVMGPRHFGQLRELIEVARSAGARRQAEEQAPLHDLLRLPSACRDHLRHDLNELGVALCGLDAPLHLDLNARLLVRWFGVPPGDDVIKGVALVALLERNADNWRVNADRDTDSPQKPA
jgi:hypothetical protein